MYVSRDLTDSSWDYQQGIHTKISQKKLHMITILIPITTIDIKKNPQNQWMISNYNIYQQQYIYMYMEIFL